MHTQEDIFRFNLFAIFVSFFVMGFIDIVGVSTSFIKNDFALSDTTVNILPMMAFLWFAIFSLPSGVLIGHIGNRNVVIISLLFTIVSMVLPLISYTYSIILFSFMILGISNTMLQVSLNPLLLNNIGTKKITGMIAFGNFVKAISSTLGPVIISLSISNFDNWNYIFWIYAIISLVALLLLLHVNDNNYVYNKQKIMFRDILNLLRHAKMRYVFSVILFSVGFEIALMTVVPKYLLEQTGCSIDKAGLGCSVYFVGRTLGIFIGSLVFNRLNNAYIFMIISILSGIVSFVMFMSANNFTFLLALLFVIGFTCANIFPYIFSKGLNLNIDHQNEASSLMIMGVAGGAIIPIIMGVMSDCFDLFVSLFVPLLILLYIIFALSKTK